MRITIDLKYDNTINVSGLLISEKDFPYKKLKEALIYIRECIEKERAYNKTLNLTSLDNE